MVGEEKVVLFAIPKEERADIIAARQRRGLPITEQKIAETYVRVHGKAPSERAGPFDKDPHYLKNAGMALASGAGPSTAAGLWGIARSGAEVLSHTVTGPLTGKVLPEDIGARMADAFAKQQRQQAARAGRMMPKVAGGGFD